MSKSIKQRAALALAFAVSSVGIIGGVAGSFVESAAAAPAVAYNGTLTDAFSGSTANRSAVDTLTNSAFDGGVSLIYTLLKFMVDFFTQPTVLAVIAGIIALYVIAGAVIRRLKRKSIGGS